MKENILLINNNEDDYHVYYNIDNHNHIIIESEERREEEEQQQLLQQHQQQTEQSTSIDNSSNKVIKNRKSNCDSCSNGLIYTIKQLKPFILYCSFSFLFSFDPSEPYLVEYMTNVLKVPPKVVYNEIFPYWTYAYFFFLFIFGFLGEIIGYKSIIIIGMIAKGATTAILLTTNDIGWLIVEQLTDGMSFAAYIVFLAFIYFSLDPEEYQKMACRVNVGYLVGIVSSGLLGQLLVTRVSLVTLLCMALGTNVAALLVAFVFHNHKASTRFALKKFIHDLGNAYRDTDIIRWYIWSGVAISIHQIVLTYWQSLFLATNHEQQWNGYISSGAYFFAAFVATIPARLGNSINNIKNYILIGFGLLGGTLLIIMGIGANIYLSTLCFIIYNCCFEFMSPIVNVQIAKKLTSRVGLLFSFNIMIALAVQVIIQLSVSNKVFNLDITHQFLYFGGCLLLLSIGFTILFISLHISKKYREHKEFDSYRQQLLPS